MIADALALILLLAMAGLGWFRGALVQVASLLAVLLLWVFWSRWFPPVDDLLVGVAMPLAEHAYLRKLIGALGAYLAVLVAFAVLELVTRRSRAADQGGRWLGVGIGALKGAAYVVVLAWVVETATLWDKPADVPSPSWLRESKVVRAVAPYHPVRVMTLKEVVERDLARAELRAREAERSELDEAALAATPDGRPAERSRPPALSEREALDARIDALHLTDDGRARALYRASPVRALMDETASLSEWQGRGYGELVRDPRVREVMGDADLADLLMGE